MEADLIGNFTDYPSKNITKPVSFVKRFSRSPQFNYDFGVLTALLDRAAETGLWIHRNAMGPESAFPCVWSRDSRRPD